MIDSKDFQKKIKIAAFIIFMITAFFSVGHLQSDEHFQVLEFAQYKLGKISANDLPWEFGEKMRPSIQPWIVYSFINLFDAIGLNNPFVITLIFRIFSGILLWYVIISLNKIIIEKYFKVTRWANIFYATSLLLWFIPFTSVRFSSENISALFLLLGFLQLFRKQTYVSFAIIGLFWGLSFLFRYQLGLSIFGTYAFLLFIQRIHILKLAISVIPLFLIIRLGVYLDTLFYDEFTIAPYNYLKANILDDKASNFGTSPFFAYLYLFLGKAIPPISLILFAGFISSFKPLKKNIFLWSIIPFILIHSFIAHKEIRFMFPVNYLFIFMSVYGLMNYFKDKEIKNWHSKLIKFSVYINILLLVVMAFKPMNGTVKLFKYVYNNLNKTETHLISTKRPLYSMLVDLQSSFYTAKNIKNEVVKPEDLAQYLRSNNIKNCYILHEKFDLAESLDGYSLEKVYSEYPEWIKSLKFIDWQKKLRTKTIYKLTKKEE
ncbi:hypothetical protein ACOSP6_14235 [Tenacibaculum sp. MEBiC06402]|uniref:hypothetical protein n=1 Tax=unclassified Tenacibaculum TaxID=2635139 RepID=UPI003B9BC98B